MQRNEHNSDLCTPLHHDEVEALSKQRIEINKNPNSTIIIEESYEPSIPAGGKEETNIPEEK